jgi:hypothetical protein
MKSYRLFFWAVLASLFVGCSKDEDPAGPNIYQGDYQVKEYALERDPNVNVWGAGMDLIHDDSGSDTTYLEETDDFPFDLKFYTVKAYYTDDNGDTQSEGCPAVLLASGTMGCKIGIGITYFDSLTIVTPEMVAKLTAEHIFNYDDCKNAQGKYDRTMVLAQLDQCIIGESFRSGVLVIADGSTEQESQAVYLIKTREGGYAKFMVKQFKGDVPNQKQTIVRWQVISE